MSEIKDQVIAIIVDKLNVEEAEVTNEASFTNDLGADSLDTVELIIVCRIVYFKNFFLLIYFNIWLNADFFNCFTAW